jgi:hypothetical protein
MFTTVRELFPEAIERSIHLSFGLILVFLTYDFKGKQKRKFSFPNIGLALLCVENHYEERDRTRVEESPLNAPACRRQGFRIEE